MVSCVVGGGGGEGGDGGEAGEGDDGGGGEAVVSSCWGSVGAGGGLVGGSVIGGGVGGARTTSGACLNWLSGHLPETDSRDGLIP